MNIKDLINCLRRHMRDLSPYAKVKFATESEGKNREILSIYKSDDKKNLWIDLS